MSMLGDAAQFLDHLLTAKLSKTVSPDAPHYGAEIARVDIGQRRPTSDRSLQPAHGLQTVPASVSPA
ncbi:MAG: hypothetical protein AB7O59_01025 [Pirellulales bacterium]